MQYVQSVHLPFYEAASTHLLPITDKDVLSNNLQYSVMHCSIVQFKQYSAASSVHNLYNIARCALQTVLQC